MTQFNDAILKLQSDIQTLPTRIFASVKVGTKTTRTASKGVQGRARPRSIAVFAERETSASKKARSNITKVNTAINKQIEALRNPPKPVIVSKPVIPKLTGPAANPIETPRPKLEPLALGVGTSTPGQGISNTSKALIVGAVGLVLFG